MYTCISSDSIAKGVSVNPSNPTRRAAFGTAALGALAYRRVLGANDRVQVGFIGYGLIGAQHVFDFKNQKDVDLAAMCDVYQPRLEQGVAATGQVAKPYSDFRKMLDNKDLQAVVVSHSGPLARPDDHHGVRGRQGRLRREAPHRFRQRRPLDGERGAQVQPRRAGRHAAALRQALSARAPS